MPSTRSQIQATQVQRTSGRKRKTPDKNDSNVKTPPDKKKNQKVKVKLKIRKQKQVPKKQTKYKQKHLLLQLKREHLLFLNLQLKHLQKQIHPTQPLLPKKNTNQQNYPQQKTWQQKRKLLN